MKRYLITSLGLLILFGMSNLSFGSSRNHQEHQHHKPYEQVNVEVSLSHSTLVYGDNNKVYLKVALEGIPFSRKQKRVPLNLALVIDRSGSMRGSKMNHAKNAAIAMLDYLDEDDVLSIISYDDRVELLLPATKVTNRRHIIRKIKSLYARGSTALYSGVRYGEHEIDHFLSPRYINRIILLSDGVTNVGPSSADALGELAHELMDKNISVTTFGMGLDYNEDLMVSLANHSDGNHDFILHSEDLSDVFDHEFNDLLSVVAQEIEIVIHCASGVTPLNVLGREGSIRNNKVYLSLNQLYANQEKYLLVELDIVTKNHRNRHDSHDHMSKRSYNDDYHREDNEDHFRKKRREHRVASVKVSYRNMSNNRLERLRQIVTATLSSSHHDMEGSRSREVMIGVTEQLGVQRNLKAIRLRDAGQTDAAKILFKKNLIMLEAKSKELHAPALGHQGNLTREVLQNLDSDTWNQQRKQISKDQYQIQTQQSY